MCHSSEKSFPRLGYHPVAFVEVFQEWELELNVDDSVLTKLRMKYSSISQAEYRDEEDEQQESL